jgi:hypothetical protein
MPAPRIPETLRTLLGVPVECPDEWTFSENDMKEVVQQMKQIHSGRRRVKKIVVNLLLQNPIQVVAGEKDA